MCFLIWQLLCWQDWFLHGSREMIKTCYITFICWTGSFPSGSMERSSFASRSFILRFQILHDRHFHICHLSYCKLNTRLDSDIKGVNMFSVLEKKKISAVFVNHTHNSWQQLQTHDLVCLYSMIKHVCLPAETCSGCLCDNDLLWFLYGFISQFIP